MAAYQIGDKVRVLQVPPYLHRDNPIDRETAEFIGRCVGKVFPIRGFDEHGQLELWATEHGNPRRRLGANSHWIWMEPGYVAPSPAPVRRPGDKAEERNVRRGDQRGLPA
jgi:hypothetical protein